MRDAKLGRQSGGRDENGEVAKVRDLERDAESKECREEEVRMRMYLVTWVKVYTVVIVKLEVVI